VPGERWPLGALRHARSADGGRSWGAPTSVTVARAGEPFGSFNFHALYAAPGGALYAAWLSSDRRKSATFLARSTDDGRTWSAPSRVNAGESCPCCRTALASPGGDTVYVAWRQVFPGPAGTVRDVVVARSSDGGATWAAPVRVHADNWVFDGCPHAGPSLQVDAAGCVHVAWWTGRQGAAGVYYARSDDGARSFRAPVALGVAEYAQPSHVQLALGADGLVAAAWDDGTLRVPRVVLRVSRNGGATFGDAQAVSADGRAGTFPVLAVNGRRLTVAWAEQSADAAAHAAHHAADERDPKAVMGLPQVGENQVLARTGSVE
jgi:BNR repeat-like domain